MLEKTLENPLDFKEIQPVNPKENQSWIFIGRTDAKAETPILWPTDRKNWLLKKEPDAGKEWRQEETGMTEDWEGNRQEGQGSLGGERRLQVPDIFISLKRQEETNQQYIFFSVQI